MTDRYVKKNAGIGECRVYELLAEIAPQYNNTFDVLELPVAYDIKESERQIVLPKYGGRTFNDLWSESDGGARMGDSLASREAAISISDLSKVDVADVQQFVDENGFSKSTFDFNEWKRDFSQRSEHFVAEGQLSQGEAEGAAAILETSPDSHLIFSNGDFYPRNFVLKDGKLVLIDWQTWDEDYRVNLLDLRDNIVAFGFIHMWGNRPWQEDFVREARSRFQLDPKSFQRALLIKAFDQAWFWRNHANLCRAQLEMAREALSLDQVQKRLGSSGSRVP